MKPVALTAAAVAAFGLTVGAALTASAFNDVTDNHPASAEITAAHQVGVFQGYGDGTFRPDGKLTRGQAELGRVHTTEVFGYQCEGDES